MSNTASRKAVATTALATLAAQRGTMVREVAPTTKGPATVAAFRKAAEAGFRKANPEAVAAGVTLTWVEAPRAVTFPTGRKGYMGRLWVEAPGFRARFVSASYVETGGLMVR